MDYEYAHTDLGDKKAHPQVFRGHMRNEACKRACAIAFRQDTIVINLVQLQVQQQLPGNELYVLFLMKAFSPSTVYKFIQLWFVVLFRFELKHVYA